MTAESLCVFALCSVCQVKKVNRWRCKVCGEKQSLLKEFGRGSGADCRRHVQKLNAMRGDMMGAQEHHNRLLWEQAVADGEEETEQERDNQVTEKQGRQTQLSRWSKYMDTPEEAQSEEENVLMLHVNNVTDRKRKRTDTPEQSNCSSLMRKPVRPSATTRSTSLTHTSPPSMIKSSPTSPIQSSLTHTGAQNLNLSSMPSLTHTSPPGLNRSSPFNLASTSPPSMKRINPPSQTSGPVSRWTRFLSTGCQVQEGEEPSFSGRSQPIGGATSLSCGDAISSAPPLRPVLSMFEIGDEFSFDDEEFLSEQRV
ncbi:MRN complex-interacting protein isoform X2 [Xiphias gladius]|uniref:MRN complex-interacting protein isoform X2 n=1 Tax=Xiphias gladius TaxID=8245 RepID=UPI001A98D790|nr:MRN complex-interacting protein isoform X2 [Xiphias gladius]